MAFYCQKSAHLYLLLCIYLGLGFASGDFIASYSFNALFNTEAYKMLGNEEIYGKEFVEWLRFNAKSIEMRNFSWLIRLLKGFLEYFKLFFK